MAELRTYLMVEGTYTRVEDGGARVYGAGDKVELGDEAAAALGAQVQLVELKAESPVVPEPKAGRSK